MLRYVQGNRTLNVKAVQYVHNKNSFDIIVGRKRCFFEWLVRFKYYYLLILTDCSGTFRTRLNSWMVSTTIFVATRIRPLAPQDPLLLTIEYDTPD